MYTSILSNVVWFDLKRLISVSLLGSHDLTRTSIGSRFEKLPRVEAAPVGVVDFRVRPILENSTACTKSNAKNPGHLTVWWVFGIPLEID
jgi:hypothetical protein